MPRRATPVLFLVALAAGCASGISSSEGWNVVKTKHFAFHTGVAEHEYAPTLTALEYSYASLSSSFFKNVDVGQVDVLYLDTQDFEGLFGYLRKSGAALPQVPGGGRIGKGGLVVISKDPDGNAGAEMLTHLFIHKMIPAAPLWFHEGFSAFTRNYEFKEGGGQRVGCFGKPAGEPESYVPLKELFTMSWDQYDGDGARSWYKHTARSLVDFIMFGENGKYIEKMPGIIDALAGGKPSAEVITGALGAPVDQLNNKVVEHGNSVGHAAQSGAKTRGLCPIGFPIPDDRAPDVGERKAEPVPAADMQGLVDGLKKLPRLEGYPSWFPPDVLAKGGGG